MTSRPKQSAKKSAVIQALAICAMLVLAWLLSRRGEPERLLRLEDTPINFRIAGGIMVRRAYRDIWKPRGPVIVARPVRGAAETVIVEDDPRFQFSSPNTFSADRDGIVYALSPFRAGGAMPGIAGAIGSGPLLVFGGPSPPMKRKGARSRAAADSDLPAGIARPVLLYRFRQASIKGGPPRDLATIRAVSATLVGRTVFWVRPAPVPRPVKPGNIRHKQDTPKSGELMCTSLADRSERRIRSGVSLDTTLMPGSDGVFWTEPGPLPDAGQELLYARASDGVPRRLGAIASDETVRWSVEYRGRVYWLQGTPGLHADGSDTGVLMSAGLDGSDVREVCTLADVHRQSVSGRGAVVWHGSLYLILTDVTGPLTDETLRLNCLCRLRSGQNQGIEVVRALPATSMLFQFDQGYAYYVSKEKDVGPIRALTDDSPGPVTNILYRVPLP